MKLKTSKTHVKIKVVNTKVLQSRLQTSCDVRVVGVPELAGDEDVLTRNTAVDNTLANLNLVTYIVRYIMQHISRFVP